MGTFQLTIQRKGDVNIGQVKFERSLYSQWFVS